MSNSKLIMRLIPVFLILLFFTGILVIIYIFLTTISHRKRSLFGSEEGNDVDWLGGCIGCDTPLSNFRKMNPQAGGSDVWVQQLSSVDEVALYGEDYLRQAERVKYKVVANLRRHIVNGAKGHLNHYGVNFSQLRPRNKKPNRQKIMCRIKHLNFHLLNPKSHSIFSSQKFPAEPLFSDVTKFKGHPVMETEVKASDDVDRSGSNTVDEPWYRSCAVVPSSGALDGSQHGLDIDSHDFIIRFNNAPTNGFEEDVGSLTSLRILNSQVFTKREFQFPSSSYFNYSGNEDEVLKNVDALWSSTRKYLIWDPCNFTATVDQWFHHPDHPFFHKYFDLMNYKKDGRNYYILSCRVLWKLWELLYENTFARIYGNPPTSGFLGIILAMQKCEKVNVYEYIPSIRESSRCYYYSPKNESNPTCTYGSWHPVSAEKLFFLNLSDGSDKEIFMDGLLSLPGVSKFKC